jgi:hypothetical protein
VLAVVHDKHHTICTVVGCGDGFNSNLPESQSFTGRKIPDVFDLTRLVSLRCPISFGGHVDRQAELAMVDPHAAGVVDMVV